MNLIHFVNVEHIIIMITIIVTAGSQSKCQIITNVK